MSELTSELFHKASTELRTRFDELHRKSPITNSGSNQYGLSSDLFVLQDGESYLLCSPSDPSKAWVGTKSEAEDLLARMPDGFVDKFTVVGLQEAFNSWLTRECVSLAGWR